MRKYISKILIIGIPIVAAFILLYPTYDASKLEAMKQKVLNEAKRDTSATDSLALIEKFEDKYGKDLESAKSKRLKLGLDLRGGMYVTLEADIVKLIEESALKESVDDIFNQVIEKTRQDAKNSDESVIKIFLRNFDKIARPKGKSLISYFDVGDLRDASEDKIIDRLNKNAENAVDQALEVIRQRIDKYGIAEPTIQKQGTRRILLELPGVNNEVEMRKLLQTTARLEFNLVKNNREIVRAFYKIDQLLSGQAKRAKIMGIDTTKESAKSGIDTNNKANKTEIAELKTKEEKKQEETKSEKGKKENQQAGEDSLKSQSSDTNAANVTADTSNPYAGLSENEARKRYVEDHPFTSLFTTYYIAPGNERNSQPISYTLKLEQYPEGEYNFLIFSGLVLPHVQF